MLKMGAVELLVTMAMWAPNLVGGIFSIVSFCILGILFHQEFFSANATCSEDVQTGDLWFIGAAGFSSEKQGMGS